MIGKAPHEIILSTSSTFPQKHNYGQAQCRQGVIPANQSPFPLHEVWFFTQPYVSRQQALPRFPQVCDRRTVCQSSTCRGQQMFPTRTSVGECSRQPLGLQAHPSITPATHMVTWQHGILHSPVTSRHGLDADGEHNVHVCLECVIVCEGRKRTRGCPRE